MKNRKKSVGFLGPEAAASPWLPQLLALRWAVEGPTASVLAACQPQKITPIPWPDANDAHIYSFSSSSSPKLLTRTFNFDSVSLRGWTTGQLRCHESKTTLPRAPLSPLLSQSPTHPGAQFRNLGVFPENPLLLPSLHSTEQQVPLQVWPPGSLLPPLAPITTAS